MKSITVQELKKKIDHNDNIQIIDVREDWEVEAANFGAEHIPMGEISKNIDKISTSKEVIIHCRSGKRSGRVIQFLETNHGFENLYNLEGGIMAWANEIDDRLNVQ